MHEDIINRYIQSYNDRDIEGMLDCVTEDVIFEIISRSLFEIISGSQNQTGCLCQGGNTCLNRNFFTKGTLLVTL